MGFLGDFGTQYDAGKCGQTFQLVGAEDPASRLHSLKVLTRNLQLLIQYSTTAFGRSRSGCLDDTYYQRDNKVAPRLRPVSISHFSDSDDSASVWNEALGCLLCITVPTGLAVAAYFCGLKDAWPVCAVVILGLAYVGALQRALQVIGLAGTALWR